MRYMSFNQYLTEMSTHIGDVEFRFSNHFSDRVKERSVITPDDLNTLLANIRKKLTDLPAVGEFLFYSKRLAQGVIAAWDSFRNRISLITFLPKNKHFAKPGTETVVLESITYQIIYID